MSWLARSIANSLHIDDFDADDNNHFKLPSAPPQDLPEAIDTAAAEGDLRGVKVDLTEFRDSFTRQLLDVASFLAPPPAASPSSSSQSHFQRVVNDSTRSESFDPSISRGDGDDDDDDDDGEELSVFGRVSKAKDGNCKSSSQSHFQQVVKESTRSESFDPSISKGDDDDDGGGDDDGEELSVFGRVSKVKDGNYQSSSSSHKLRLQSLDENEDDDDNDDDDDDYIKEAVGLTDEVLTFARNIAHHPETWLDFPVEDDEDMEDFPMSEYQERHAQAVECLTPRLAALRIELCPTHMSVGFFWKVYFVLLHSRLNKQDAVLLSTPEVVEARAKWMQEQQKRAKKESDWFHSGLYSRASDEDCTPRSQQNDHSETLSSWTFASEPATYFTTVDSDMEKHISTDPQIMDKSVDEKPFEETDNKQLFLAPISKRPVLSFINNDDDDESDEWPEDDCLDQSGTLIPLGIADEVSFSDLEDDDCCIPVISKP